MTAEKMRILTNKSVEDKRVAKLNEHHAHAKRITDTKFRKKARKGFNSCEFKVSHWYSPKLVAEALVDLGYEVQGKCKNGKQYLVAKW